VHVVMSGLLSAYRVVIVVHDARPVSDIDERLRAESIVRVFENGEHDVIRWLLSVVRDVILVHDDKPVSVMPHDSRADMIWRFSDIGSHDVMSILLSAISSVIDDAIGIAGASRLVINFFMYIPFNIADAIMSCDVIVLLYNTL